MTKKHVKVTTKDNSFKKQLSYMKRITQIGISPQLYSFIGNIIAVVPMGIYFYVKSVKY